MKFVTPVVSNNGVFNGLRESLRVPRKGNEFNLQGITQCATEATIVALVQGRGKINVTAADRCHPHYNVAHDVKDPLHPFVTNTLNRAANQVCTDEII